MLIILDESIIADIATYTDVEISHLEDLLYFHSKKFHYVGATRKISKMLLVSFPKRLSARAQATLESIATQSDNLSPLTSATRFFAVVNRGGLAGMIRTAHNNRIIWTCDLAFAAKWFSQASKIIGEHLTDSGIYRSAARHFSVTRGLDSRMQSLSLDMCGGSGNADIVLSHRILEANSPVICIIDSDKIASDRAPSESVKKCHDVVSRLRGVSYFFALNERELENAIPFSIVSKAILTLDASKDRDEILKRAYMVKDFQTAHPELYKYVDLKLGTCKTWIKGKGLQGFFRSAPVSSLCDCSPNCEGSISPKIFEDLLSRVAKVLENISDKNLRNEVVDDAETEWFNIGSLVYSMGLSNNIQLT
jgi:hypothetical protein